MDAVNRVSILIHWGPPDSWLESKLQSIRTRVIICLSDVAIARSHRTSQSTLRHLCELRFWQIMCNGNRNLLVEN